MDIKKIIGQMEMFVEKVMTSFKSDFYQYDIKTIHDTPEKNYPLIWFIAPTHTYLIDFKEYAMSYAEKETVRFDWNDPSGNFFDAYLQEKNNQQVYLINIDGIKQINMSEARSIVHTTINQYVSEYEKEFGKFNADYKIRIKLNIPFNKLKELLKDCQAHNDTSLMDCLKQFKRWRKTVSNHYIQINYRSDNELSFAEMINGTPNIVGGIIFHGWPETGYKENYSVSISPSYGWKIHT